MGLVRPDSEVNHHHLATIDASMAMDVDSHSVEHASSQSQTQPLSQPGDGSSQRAREAALDRNSWGLLISCVDGLPSTRFSKENRKVTIGRNPKSTVHLLWKSISHTHAIITWNQELNNEVTVLDNSTNGTFLNGKLIGKGNVRPLVDGHILSFALDRSPNKQSEVEYKYIYRDLLKENRPLYNEYDLSVQLGRGTYATVYKAMNRRTNQWVAVKVIHQSMRPPTDDGTCREVELLKKLDHPNICKMVDYFINANRSIDLILEYMDGRDLLHFMNERLTDMTEWMSWHLTLQICKALAYIHTLRITHRDLKPENILLTLTTPPLVKIADFGWAKLVDEQTALTTICGTPTYIAPEIIMRRLPYTDKVDSWSVGAVVFLMFTRDTPLPRVQDSELHDLIRQEFIDWKSLERLEHVTPDAKDFIHKLLDFNPETRLDLQVAEFHPWLMSRDPTYDVQYPADANADIAVLGTEPLSGVGNNAVQSPRRPVPMREGTADPYADDDAPPLRRATSFDPYADDPYANPYGPIVRRLNPISEASQATSARQAAALATSRGDDLTHSQEDDYIYGKPASQPQLVATATGPKTPRRTAQTRTFTEMMHREGSSPLTDLDSPPPPRKKGKGVARTGTAETKPKAPIPRQPKGRKKKAAETNVEMPPAPTATRKSSRAVRPPRR